MTDNIYPENWEEKTLGEVAAIGAGNSAPQKEELFENGKHYFFRTSDVGKIHFGTINSSHDLLNDDGIKGLKLFKKGTILFPKSGASTFLNHRVMMNVDGYVVSHLATIKAKDEILDDKFLLYYLFLIDSKTLVQDQNYPSLNLGIINNIVVRFPSSLEEQRKIADILENLQEQTGKLEEIYEQKIKNIGELRQTMFQKAFRGEL